MTAKLEESRAWLETLKVRQRLSTGSIMPPRREAEFYQIKKHLLALQAMQELEHVDEQFYVDAAPEHVRSTAQVTLILLAAIANGHLPERHIVDGQKVKEAFGSTRKKVQAILANLVAQGVLRKTSPYGQHSVAPNASEKAARMVKSFTFKLDGSDAAADQLFWFMLAAGPQEMQSAMRGWRNENPGNFRNFGFFLAYCLLEHNGHLTEASTPARPRLQDTSRSSLTMFVAKQRMLLRKRHRIANDDWLHLLL